MIIFDGFAVSSVPKNDGALFASISFSRGRDCSARRHLVMHVYSTISSYCKHSITSKFQNCDFEISKKLKTDPMCENFENF